MRLELSMKKPRAQVINHWSKTGRIVRLQLVFWSQKYVGKSSSAWLVRSDVNDMVYRTSGGGELAGVTSEEQWGPEGRHCWRDPGDIPGYI